MRIERIVCDRCGKEIPKVTSTDFFGRRHEEYKFGVLNYGFPFNNVDLGCYGIDICEKCALEIRVFMYEWKLQVERGHV